MDILREWIEEALNFLDYPGVVGVGVGMKEVGGRQTDRMCLTVMVQKKLPAGEIPRKHLIPEQVRSIATDVLEVGKLRAHVVAEEGSPAHPVGDVYLSRLRPARPGSSIGHFREPTGTFGAVVRDRETGRLLILSNNHVLANSSNGHDGRARPGDPILQPGPEDGGTPKDVLARLSRFVPLFLDKANDLDCAVAEPLKEDLVDPEIIGLGPVAGLATPTINMTVLKSGRGSGVTRGKVLAVNATVRVEYSVGLLKLQHQVVCSRMSQSGDSGSLLVDANNRAIGVVFSGSRRLTVSSPIKPVLDALNVDLVVAEPGRAPINRQR